MGKTIGSTSYETVLLSELVRALSPLGDKAKVKVTKAFIKAMQEANDIKIATVGVSPAVEVADAPDDEDAPAPAAKRPSFTVE